MAHLTDRQIVEKLSMIYPIGSTACCIYCEHVDWEEDGDGDDVVVINHTEWGEQYHYRNCIYLIACIKYKQIRENC